MTLGAWASGRRQGSFLFHVEAKAFDRCVGVLRVRCHRGGAPSSKLCSWLETASHSRPVAVSPTSANGGPESDATLTNTSSPVAAWRRQLRWDSRAGRKVAQTQSPTARAARRGGSTKGPAVAKGVSGRL